MPSFRVPLRPIWGPDFVPAAGLQCSRVLPACGTPAPRRHRGRNGMACFSVQCPVLGPVSTAGTGGTPHRRRCTGCDQGCDHKETATSQGGSGPAGLALGGRSQGWDGQVPGDPPPASWVARGRRRFPWPFGVSGSVGLRKESVSLLRAGPGDLTQEPHPASGRPCLRSLRKPQQASLGAGRFLSSLCCSPSVKTQDGSRGPHFTAGGLTKTGSLKARK